MKPAQCAPPPSHDGSFVSAQSTTPPSGLTSQAKITLADTAGVAQARIAEMDTNVRIFGPSRSSSSPTSVPTISVSGTTTSAKYRLILSDTQNSWSCRIWL